MSQNQQVLKHLMSGAPITALEAIEQYGILRLAARVCDLRDREHIIHKVMIDFNGKKVAKYYMRNPQQTLEY